MPSGRETEKVIIDTSTLVGKLVISLQYYLVLDLDPVGKKKGPN